MNPAGTEITPLTARWPEHASSWPRPKRRSRAKVDDRKRAVYVQQACSSCKARKIKCNGQLPCESCGKRSLDCQYANQGQYGEAGQNQETATSMASDESRTM